MAVTRVRIVYYSHSCECRGVPFHSPLQLHALVVYTLLVVLSPQRVSQGFLYPPRGLIHSLFASPLDGTVSSSFPHPPPLQRRWQTHFPQLTLRLAQNFSPITYLRQGIEWLSHECELFTIRIATIVIYLVLQSTPTHLNEVFMKWQGILQLLQIGQCTPELKSD